MKKIYLLVVFTIINISLFAQSPTLDWAMKLGSNYNVDSTSYSEYYYSGSDICVGQDGFIYTVGKFKKTIDFNGTDPYNACNTGGLDESLYILKLDKQGNIIWKKYICSENSYINLVIDQNNNLNLLIMQDYKSILDSTFTSSAADTIYSGINFVRLNNNGNLIWNKNFKTLGAYNFVRSYLFDSHNNLYVFGAFANPIDFNPNPQDTLIITPNNRDAFILKLNTNGDFVWVKTIKNNCAFSNSSIDKQDNIYVTGEFKDSVNINIGVNNVKLYSNYTHSNGLSNADFIIKIDTNANLVWHKSFNDAYIKNITVDKYDNLFIQTKFKDSTSFIGINNHKTFYSNKLNAAFTKYNSYGELIWAKQLGNLEHSKLKTDKSGNVFSNGYFYSTTFLNSDDTTIKTTSKGNSDMYLLKLDSSGNHVFDFTTGGKKVDLSVGMDIDEDFNIYMTGTFNDTIDFDPSSVVENLNCHDTVRSIFITKFNQYPLAVNSVTKNSIAKLYPNPNNGIFTIDIKENATVMITNSFGQLVSKSQIKKGISTFNLQNHTAGIYFVQLQTDKDFEAIKIVIE